MKQPREASSRRAGASAPAGCTTRPSFFCLHRCLLVLLLFPFVFEQFLALHVVTLSKYGRDMGTPAPCVSSSSQGIGPTSEATWSLAQMLLAKLPPVEDLPQLVQSPPDIMRTPAGCCKRRDAYAREKRTRHGAKPRDARHPVVPPQPLLSRLSWCQFLLGGLGTHARAPAASQNAGPDGRVLLVRCVVFPPRLAAV